MMITKSVLRKTLCILSFSLACTAWADAPIFDASSSDTGGDLNKPATARVSAPAVVNMSGTGDASTANLSNDQRLTIIERQVNNLTQMNLVSQLNNLQQQVQELHGQIESQNHTIQVLQEQLRNQYQDLDKRLGQQAASGKSAKAEGTKATDIAVDADKPVNVKSGSSADNVAGSDSKANADTKSSADLTAKSSSSSSASSNPDAALKEQGNFQTAYNYVKSKDAGRAIPALQSFLKRYPESVFAVSAHYWLGEMYLQKGQNDQAISEFNTVVSKYPNNIKMADAHLKLGLAYANKGMTSQAKDHLQKVVQDYPVTPAAKLAKARLELLVKQGK